MTDRPNWQEFTKAMRSAAARAASNAQIEVEGSSLSVTLTLAPNAVEKRAMAKLLDARALKAKQAADVVRGLAEGKLPTAGELASFRAAPGGGN